MEDTETIRISVVIPAYNEEKYLAACIGSLKRQAFAHSYEIIVVDNHSTDRTTKVAMAAGARVVYEPHPGITWARQRGFEAAKGEIIACVDADTCVAPDWLARIDATLNNDEDAVGVAGRIFYTKGKTWRGNLPALLVGPLLYSDLVFRFLFRKPGVLWGGNFAVKRSALIEAGGFNREIEFYGEDTELSLRLALIGRIKFDRRQRAWTSPRRYENKAFWKTVWPYLTTFVHLVAASKTADGNGRARSGSRKLALRFLYAGVPLLVATGLITSSFYPTSQLFGKVYCAGLDHQVKRIALTFDDGPDEPYTSEVLRILDEHKIKATFFLVGKNAAYYPVSVKKIVSDGQIIGNHSYDHSYLLPFESRLGIQDNIAKTENILYGLTGLRTRMFRPPHGLRTPWMLRDIKDLHYNIVTWTDMTDDYDLDKSPEAIVREVIKAAKPGGIIDLHDGKNLNHGINRSNTVMALPIIIEKLQQEGYEFVTLPQLLKVDPYQKTAATHVARPEWETSVCERRAGG